MEEEGREGEGEGEQSKRRGFFYGGRGREINTAHRRAQAQGRYVCIGRGS